MWQNFRMLQTFKCCGYCRVLKNVENVARIKKKKKYYNVADPTICCGCGRVVYKRGLPNVAKSLKNVANEAQPTKIV